jgi:hypothetical protein
MQLKSSSHYLFTLFLALSGIPTTSFSTGVPLHNKMVSLMDGCEIGAEQVYTMIHIIKEIIKRQYGVKKGNERLGMFTFSGKSVSIHSLVQLEAQALERNDENAISELQSILRQAKDEFVIFMQPFLDNIHEMPRHTTHALMREWADIHNRHDSLIFEWSKFRQLADDEIFNQRITTFKEVDQFCSDLRSFLDDLIKSCPVAYQQYKDLIKQSSPHHE